MCMLDDSDGLVTMLSTADPVARKEHKCRECFRTIQAGERYHVDRFVFEGRLEAHKVCSHCMVAREWLSTECGGWLFGGVEEDIREHVHNGAYSIGVYRMAVGMAWKWRTPSGKMLPIPSVPKTTHEITAAAAPAPEHRTEPAPPRTR
jgi:hypothetical protein